MHPLGVTCDIVRMSLEEGIFTCHSHVTSTCVMENSFSSFLSYKTPDVGNDAAELNKRHSALECSIFSPYCLYRNLRRSAHDASFGKISSFDFAGHHCPCPTRSHQRLPPWARQTTPQVAFRLQTFPRLSPHSSAWRSPKMPQREVHIW